MKTFESFNENHQRRIRNEIIILKRLRHHHIIDLVGSMTQTPLGYEQGSKLSALFWPVAPCSFENFFGNINSISLALCRGDLEPSTTDESIGDERLKINVAEIRDIVYPTTSGSRRKYRVDKILKAAIRRVFASFGCLTEALFYVHRQMVSHKDIKPPNILIYPNEASYQSTGSNPGGEVVRDGLRLTDFDGAKDMAQADISLAEHRVYTEAYASPETSKFRKSGRSADIFSMGCVYLEMLALATIYPWLKNQRESDLKPHVSLSDLRDRKGCGSYANLASGGSLLGLVDEVGAGIESTTGNRLRTVVQSMLAYRSEDRPPADQILLKLSACEKLRQLREDSTESCTPYPLFGRCCAPFSLDAATADVLLSPLPARNISDAKYETEEQTWTESAPDIGSAVRVPETTSREERTTESTDSVYEEDQENDPLDQDDSTTNDLPTASVVPPMDRDVYAVQWNKYGQRIDPPTICYDRDLFEYVKGLKLCHYRYLRGVCQDVNSCVRTHGVQHNYEASEKEILVLRALKRRQKVCSLACEWPGCFSGHNCPNLRWDAPLKDRTKTSACAHGGPGPNGKCHFPPEMHDMDLEVVHTVR